MTEEELNVVCPNKIGPYQLRGTIGHGAYAICKLAYRQDQDRYYACKIITRQRINQMKDKTRFEQEIRVLQQMRHSYIVQLYDLFKDTLNYYVVMEFCPNGELFSRIVATQRLPESEARLFFRQIIEAMVFIHSRKVAHRDLKPENILIDEKGCAKISDFGLSKFVLGNGLTSTSCGSPCYAAPEVISGKPYDPLKSDMWSLGVILYAMVTGNLPWTKRNKLQLFAQIRSGKYKIPAYVSMQCSNLINSLMIICPEKRLTAQEVLSHAFLEGDMGKVNLQPTSICGNYPIVSLRMVDDFFERDSSVALFDVTSPAQKIQRIVNYVSTGKLNLTCQKVVKLIKVKGEISPQNSNNVQSNSTDDKFSLPPSTENTNRRRIFPQPSHDTRKFHILPNASSQIRPPSDMMNPPNDRTDWKMVVKMVHNAKQRKARVGVLVRPKIKSKELKIIA
ncbi:CAMK family protein kinase [Tritrichomonas foetus]|uniref:CAMK family protein kinase n=1 Tax=Tritrichomonas foetus TaxID=1144522 RepID=A0A1J4KFB9_9EUKA|nr:CAMK family protein kinase [Tritrichomonas foetus]|eukprot:OHT10135.1 CAMK family protein kinase [Tritrichomonas foetus]